MELSVLKDFLLRIGRLNSSFFSASISNFLVSFLLVDNFPYCSWRTKHLITPPSIVYYLISIKHPTIALSSLSLVNSSTKFAHMLVCVSLAACYQFCPGAQKTVNLPRFNLFPNLLQLMSLILYASPLRASLLSISCKFLDLAALINATTRSFNELKFISRLDCNCLGGPDSLHN